MDGLYEQFRIALHSVWRRRWFALAVAWGVCLAGWLGIALIPNSYESKARVYAQMQSILPDKIGITAVERQNGLVRVRQTLTSTANLEKVVRRTDLNRLVASDRDLATQVEKLRKTIKITAQQDNLFEISATSDVGGFSNADNARTAAAIVQNLLDLFVEGNLSGDRAETGETLSFLDDELRRRESQLQQAEQRRVQFETRFMGQLPGEGSMSQRLTAARNELNQIDQQLIASQGALTAVRGQLSATPTSIALPGSGGRGVATRQIAALETQLSQARAKGWTDSHPDVIVTQAQIERLRPQAAEERNSRDAEDDGYSTPNPSYVSLRAVAAEKEAQVSAASTRKQQIETALAQLEESQSDAPEVVAEQARLNRDYEVLKRQYDKLLEDREQVRLRSDVQNKTDAINFKIIDPPSRPIVPVAPNRPLLLSAILFVAIAIGLGAGFARGQLQTTFPTQGRLGQVTGLPVLGAITEYLSPAAKSRRRQRLKLFAGASGALAGAYALLMLVEFWQRSMVA